MKKKLKKQYLLAAHACGFTIVAWHKEGAFAIDNGRWLDGSFKWDPRNNNSDAFELLVTLEMNGWFSTYGSELSREDGVESKCFKKDGIAAAREAIFKMAVKIGKAEFKEERVKNASLIMPPVDFSILDKFRTS